MKTMTIRGYVWIFCLYLACSVEWICHRHHQIHPSVFDRSFMNLFNDAIGPILLAFMFVLSLRETKNSIERIVLILSAMHFALSAIFALHQLEYLRFGIPHLLSGWAFFLATIFLGYRTNQVLKKHDVELETKA